MCDPPRIYPSLPEYTHFFNNYMRPFQNLSLPEYTYPLFNKFICATLPESTPPPQNMRTPPFQQIYMCDPLRIYPSLPEFFNNYMRHSQRLPPPSQNAPPFSTTIGICDTSRIYPSRPDYTPSPFFTTIYSKNLPTSQPSVTELRVYVSESATRSRN